MAAPVAIRPYRDIDSLAVERCLAELQEFEAAFEPNRADPLQYAPGYREHLLTQCRESAGRLFVAELKGDIVGLVCVLARADSGDLVEKSREHAYVKEQVERAGGGNYQSLINAALLEHMRRVDEPLEKTPRRVLREELRKAS